MQNTSKLPRWKKWLFRGLGITLGLTLALVFGEILARIVYPFPANQVRITTVKFGDLNTWVPFVGYAQRFNSVRRYTLDGEFDTLLEINSHGIRGTEVDYEKSAGIFRILILGDSYIEAYQIEFNKTVMQQLQALLDKNKIGKYEVIGVGVGGWSTAQSYLYYLHEGHRYNPDLVIHVMIANDFGENIPNLTNPNRSHQFPYYILDGEKLRLEEANLTTKNHPLVEFARNVDQLLRPNSRLYAFVSDFVVARFLGMPPEVQVPPPDPSIAVSNPPPPPFPETAWEVTRRIYSMWAEKLHAENIPFIVAVGNYYAGGITDPQRELESALKAKGAYFIPMNNDFAAFIKETGQSVIGHYDQHWNEVGHQVAAESIYKWLVELNLLQTQN